MTYGILQEACIQEVVSGPVAEIYSEEAPDDPVSSYSSPVVGSYSEGLFLPTSCLPAYQEKTVPCEVRKFFCRNCYLFCFLMKKWVLAYACIILAVLYSYSRLRTLNIQSKGKARVVGG